MPNTSLLSYSRSIWRLPSIFIVVSHFMEVVFIQLADKAGEIAMFEMFRQDGLGKSFVLPYP